ncbi:phage terminase large subunit [Phreatobacter sp.]|uniref:phage terminase large subunit n=1 Tax=Phreatobacter sp. TaxID=1966341 RepID=UPI003F70A4AB
MEFKRKQLLNALRGDLSAFTHRAFLHLEEGNDYLHNWHIDHISWQLTRLARGDIRRLIINVPPRSMKSIQVSIAFSAWALGHDPTARILCVSYAEALARKLSIDTRSVMTSDWYQEAFPETELTRHRQRVLEIQTRQGGYRLAAGMGGSILGRGADLIIIDDPQKAVQGVSEAGRRQAREFYDNALVTRLNDKRHGAIILIMQRLHQDDLVGHVLERDDWEHVVLPAIAPEDASFQLSDNPQKVFMRRKGSVLHPEREPLPILEKVRQQQGSLQFSAQYQQQPVPADGNVLKRDWLRFYATVPKTFDLTMVSWDTASTLGEASDWSVATVWGAMGQDFYLLDVVRDRMEFPALRQRMIDLNRSWSADAILIEDSELGRALSQDLRRAGELRPILKKPRFDKQTRFVAQVTRFEAGQVWLPEEVPWLGAFVDELLSFPNGRHDDQVDSVSQALDHLQRSASMRTEPGKGPARKRPERPARPSGYTRPFR